MPGDGIASTARSLGATGNTDNNLSISYINIRYVDQKGVTFEIDVDHKNCEQDSYTNMNSDDKNSKVDNDAKNKNLLESITKESSRRSGIPRHKSQSANAKDKNGAEKSSISATKNLQIHEKKASTDHKRSYLQRFKEAASKTVKSPATQETKYSGVLASSDKSTALDSCKRQSSLKSKKDTHNHETKETRVKSNRRKSLPRAKEVHCAIVAPSSIERSPRRELKYGDSEGRRGLSVRSTPKDTEKVDKKQRIHDVKKCSDKFDGNEKIKPVGKQIKASADNSAGVEAPKKIDPHAVVKGKKTLDKETSLLDNGIHDATVITSGAARTRIFMPKERTRVKGFKKKVDHPTTCSPVEKQIEAEQESKTMDSTNCDIKDKKMISPNQEDLKTPECGSAHSLESRQVLANSEVKEETINHFNSAAEMSSGTSCEQMFSRDIERDSTQSNVIDDLAKILKDDANEIKATLAVTKILQSDPQDSMNYEFHSGQQSSRGSNQQAIEKYLDDTTSELFTEVDKGPSAVHIDEKYNLMKTLIHPPIENDHLKGNNRSLLLNHGLSDSVLTCKDNGFKSLGTIASSTADTTEETSSLTSSGKPSKSHCNNPQNCETWNPHASEIYLKQPISNTSDYIAMNLKMNGCKHTKKYRHYKYEERNMCCSMARYVKKMVADERRYQEIERKETPERDEVKIIIDENNPKTSKIRIVNDRSSVSVVCHSLGRIGSPGENNAAATKTESSGGESSGYRSFHNDSNAKNSDTSARMIEIKSTERNKTKHPVIMSYNPKNIHVQYHNPSAELLYNKPIAKSLESNYFNSLYVDDDPVNAYAGKVEGHQGSQNNVYTERHKRQNLEVKYKSSETKDYLSTFTNCMDVYLPCEITAYQVEERKGSGLFQLNNKERLEKDVDDAELNIGKYLAVKKSYSKDELSGDEISESSEQLGAEDNVDTLGDEVLMLKKPDNREYGSYEVVINERFLGPDDSTNVPVVPAHHKMITSPLNVMNPSDTSTNTSHARFARDYDTSVTNVESSHVDIQTSYSNATFFPLRHESTADIPTESQPHGTKGSQKDNHEEFDDSNTTVRELWTNKKTNIDSTDNDSLISAKAHCCKRDKNKHGANRFKFNIFKKIKSSASGKTVNIPIDQLPKPPCPFLKNSAPSNSTMSSSTINSDPSRSTYAEKFQASSTSIRRESSVMNSPTDTAAPMLQHAGRSRTDAVSKENITNSQRQANPISPNALKDTETHPEPYSVPVPVEQSLLPGPQALHSAVPPPASALPPPYPFCCPMAPYMMQYWQNNQPSQPSPDASWTPASTLVRSEPPPPGMVPIPWFPPMMHFNNPAQSTGGNSEMSNFSRAQPPPEWFTMPRGYAPCLPCSKMPTESLSRQPDSMSYDDDEVSLDNSIRDKKRDLKKKKVSKKLCSIFRRRNRPETKTPNEDEKQVRTNGV